ncbi:hypothetical protein P3G55_06800 [Leptospira sp. 96542]|nr:hypothetical protein [Leptospira sp. 96542]
MEKYPIPPLWGEDIPYSQAYITKEIRILEYEVTRTFYFVHADINPATYETLKANKHKIKNKEILTCLSEAEPSESGQGYTWHVIGTELITYKEAEKIADDVTQTIIEMHKLVMKFL